MVRTVNEKYTIRPDQYTKFVLTQQKKGAKIFTSFIKITLPCIYIHKSYNIRSIIHKGRLTEGLALAKVIGPAMSIAASGNVGPICFASWRNFSIARGRWSSPYPFEPTIPQVIYETMLGDLSKAWGQTLTVDERKSWEERANSNAKSNTLRQRYIPSGYQTFLSQNMNRGVCGLGLLKVAPEGRPDVTAVEMRCEWDLTEGLVTVGLDYVPLGDFPSFSQIFRAGPYASPGRRAFAHDYRLVQVVAGGVDWDDVGVVPGGYYWYRAGTVDESGVRGVRFERPVGT